MIYFNSFYLDREKDIIVNLYKDNDVMHYVLETPNYTTGNLICNLAKVCNLKLERNEAGLFINKGIVPCYIDSENREVYVFRLGNTKVANIYPDGKIEMKASILAIAKTLMSQTKDYRLDINKTIIKSYIFKECRFFTDLHTHMNGNLSPDILVALGIFHQIRYPLYYVKKLDLTLTETQKEKLEKQRKEVEKQFADSTLVGKYLNRKIDDNTFINFADLICNNIENASDNIQKIRTSLAILKEGQAVFTNLEKVYLYRYIFTKGIESSEKIDICNVSKIPDKDVKNTLRQMLIDNTNPAYHFNTLFQDKLLWIARSYKKQGVKYAEISDTTLVKRQESIAMLDQVHEIMPLIESETGVKVRFLAALRRIPLNIVRGSLTPVDYLSENLDVLKKVSKDPYVVGSDFVGEEINDIKDLQPVIKEIVKIAKDRPDWTIRIHAGENDSLIDNVAHSIQCIKESLQEGQPFPRLRVGHGLYTANLKTAKGKQLLQDLKQNKVVLEFQITSNVRLNNLNSIETHPIKQYLAAGIKCVQGSDGAALYGTSSMDEQLTLERFLNLTYEDMLKIRSTEEEIVEESTNAFNSNLKAFEIMLGLKKVKDYYQELMGHEDKIELNLAVEKKLDSNHILKEYIKEMPWDKKPIVFVGGSFNTEHRKTKVDKNVSNMIDDLLEKLDPKEVFFVVGNKLSGYEKYLVEHNKGFQVFSIVPSEISRKQANKLLKGNLNIRVSTESISMAIYKSFNYEIFEQRPSIVIAFDGNSAAANVIQEAKNGKKDAKIFVYNKASALKEKALSLHGYVHLFKENDDFVSEVQQALTQITLGRKIG